jgi:ATP-dependent Clp protease ATP-binding subunit ClpC
MEFTPRAQNAIRLADTEARKLSHPCVGSQHLVLGLFMLGGGVHYSVLRELGLTEESLRQGIAAIGSVLEQTQMIDAFAIGSSAAQALERAGREAAALSNKYTGTEHVLLGLFSEESGGAARLFAAFKTDITKGRAMIMDAYGKA